MRYPAWLPYPSCWFKAILLILSVFPLAIAYWIADRAYFVSWLAWELRYGSSDWWAWAWLVIFCLLVPIFVFGHIYQFLWGEPSKHLPWWIPSLRSWLEGLWDWWVLVTSIVTWVFFIVVFVCKLNPPRHPSELEQQIFCWGFPTLIAYFYHFRLLTERAIRRAIAKRKNSQP